jgi:hypothetical protein
MAVNPQVVSDPKAEFVDSALKAFELDPRNRDVALAECLWHLQRMDALVTQTVANMSTGPVAGLLGKLSGR